MFRRADKLCKELMKRKIDYDSSIHMENRYEWIEVHFQNCGCRVEFFEDDEGYSYFKIQNPVLFQILDYIDLNSPDYPR